MKRTLINLYESSEEKDVVDRPAKRAKVYKCEGFPLSPEQTRVVESIVSGQIASAFITGKAGTGKSVVVKTLIDQLPPTGLYVTASTGMAAAEIGGSTLHSFAGLGFGVDDAATIAERIKKKEAGDRLRLAKLIIIDEASMISGPLFDLLNEVMKLVRRSSAPFGGCRLVLVGDMGQLPPVNKSKTTRLPLIFESAAWHELNPTLFYLQTSHRQAEDKEFAAMLDEIRLGKCKGSTLEALEKAVGKQHPPEAHTVYIFPRNADVDTLNQKKLDALSGEVHSFKAEDYELGGAGGSAAQSRLKDCPFPATLDLKIGAQVMLRKNLDVLLGLFNGAIGEVKSFDEESGCPIIDFGDHLRGVYIKPQTWELRTGRNAQLIAARTQLPLILAWAISSHKSQGMTIHAPVVADPGTAFENGQVYVILSRVRRFEQLSFKSFNVSSIKADPRVIKFYEELETKEAK